jgi:membrane protease YdiL (CAAX protease family)
MHGMVAISVMLELVAVALGICLLVFGVDNAQAAQAIAYGVVGLGTWVAVDRWLAGRGVSALAIWEWQGPPAARRVLGGAAVALGLGAALGLLAVGYTSLLEWVPELRDALRAARDQMAQDESARWWLAVLAVGVAPLAEEYLFRGLLFRALDREWRDWRAIWGSACFFAIYHPPVAWVPVAVLGAASAVLFRRSGHLVPSVVLHAAYNAVVVWAA